MELSMKLLTQNSKLKKDGIFNFDIPAYKSSTGLITCPSAKDCIANCYARQGTYNFSNVKAKHESNLQASLKPDFVELMVREIKGNKRISIIRLHSAGDFYSREYVLKWFKIFAACPDIKFYAYTKSWDLFDDLALPSNFYMIQSEGGVLNIDESKPHAKVFKDEDSMPENYNDASDSDLVALLGKNVGLIYHGNKKPTMNKFINV
jgi:hypothetical protein